MTADGVQFRDMQALLRFGHGQLPQSRFLLLEIAHSHHAGKWLAQLPVSSAMTRDAAPDEAVQIAFTASGLRALGLRDDVLSEFAEEFLSGMSGEQSRSRRLGDVLHNAPEHWHWGHQDAGRLHALLMLYSREGAIHSLSQRVLNDDFQQGIAIVHELPTDLLRPTEPFGFIDGISQPAIDWHHAQRTDTHARESWSNLLAPGEIVLGHRDEYGQIAASPTVDSRRDAHAARLPHISAHSGVHDLGYNGSYLVLRQLEQDVSGFEQFLHEQSEGDAQAAEQLAAVMVGRHRDGSPLMPRTHRQIPGISRGSTRNAFDYDDDPEGLQCPIGSHVRRSNPRTGDFPPGSNSLWIRLLRMLGFKREHPQEDLIASTRFHRLLRRGRTYGSTTSSTDEPKAHTARGLQFICVGSSIRRQFEFVQSAWCSNSAFAGTHGQRDPLIGHRADRTDGSSCADFVIPDANGAPRIVRDLPHFVTVRGGAYFFLPGLRAIDYLATTAQHTSPGERS